MHKTLGIVLIVVGLIGLVWGGVTFTTKEKVIDAGPIEATRDKTHRLPIAPIAGIVALVGGAVLLTTGRRA